MSLILAHLSKAHKLAFHDLISYDTMGHFFSFIADCSMENFLWAFKFDVMTLVMSNL